MRVEDRRRVDEVVLLHEIGDSAAVHALARTSRAESRSTSNHRLHDIESRYISALPRNGLEGESDVSLRALSPSTELSTDILRLLTDELVLWHAVHLTKALSNKVYIFSMALYTAGDNEALSRGNIIHHELLHGARVDIANVVLKTEERHTKRFVAVSGSKEHILEVGGGIKLAKMLL